MTRACAPGLSRAFPRFDRHYLRLLRWDAETRLRLPGQLERLSSWHGGASDDFAPTRNRYLSRIVRYARTYSPYYQEVFENLPLRKIDPGSSEWAKVPLLDKALIRSNRGSLEAVPPDCVWAGHLTTGGSTGEPFGFPYMGGHDAEHQAFLWRMHGYQDGDRILAMDGALVPEVDRKAGRYWVPKSDSELPYGGMSLSGHYLSTETLDAYLEFLLEHRPEFIRGYPSLVAGLAGAADDRDMRLGCKGVELSSESHTSAQVALIERVFGPVFDQYGHAEASIFGYSLQASGPVYCSPMYGLVEVLREDGSHAEVGETGEVVVTGFHNFAMPFIRYRTGDLAVFGGEVDGVTHLRQVLGRTQDYVLSRDQERHLVTALVFGRHYEALSRIERWQLIQDVPGEVKIRIVRGTGFGPSDENEIRANFHDLAGIDVQFDYSTPFERTARAKSPLVIQRVET